MNGFRRTILACAASMAFSVATSAQAPDAADTAAPSPPARETTTDPAEDSAIHAKVLAAQAAWDSGPGGTSPSASPVSGASLGGVLVQVFASLAILGFAALVFVFLLRRARGGKASSQTRGGLVDILETKSVGPSRQIAMVRLHNRVVAVAFTGQSSTLLSEFTGSEAAEIVAETGDGRTPIREFAATLDGLMDRFRSNPARETESAEQEETR